MKESKPYDPGDDVKVLVGRVECVVCGKPILGLSPMDTPHLFKVERIMDKNTGELMNLYCHVDPCKEVVNEIGRHRDWRKLPSGPLRSLFKEALEK
jgi:hypothetical protein